MRSGVSSVVPGDSDPKLPQRCAQRRGRTSAGRVAHLPVTVTGARLDFGPRLAPGLLGFSSGSIMAAARPATGPGTLRILQIWRTFNNEHRVARTPQTEGQPPSREDDSLISPPAGLRVGMDSDPDHHASDHHGSPARPSTPEVVAESGIYPRSPVAIRDNQVGTSGSFTPTQALASRPGHVVNITSPPACNRTQMKMLR